MWRLMHDRCRDDWSLRNFKDRCGDFWRWRRVGSRLRHWWYHWDLRYGHPSWDRRHPCGKEAISTDITHCNYLLGLFQSNVTRSTQNKLLWTLSLHLNGQLSIFRIQSMIMFPESSSKPASLGDKTSARSQAQDRNSEISWHACVHHKMVQCNRFTSHFQSK